MSQALNRDVAVYSPRVRRAGAGAQRHEVEPRHEQPRSTPQLEGQHHPARERATHLREIGAVGRAVECKRPSALLEPILDPDQRAIGRHKILDVLKWAARIYDAIVLWAEPLAIDKPAIASRAALVATGYVLARRARAIVCRHLHRVHIRLDRVHLPAPDSADLVGVAVVVAKVARRWPAVIAKAWHGYPVERRITGAPDV
mmetsp:Transcript_40040/g.116803  ORF Transcript_40040/g.116803 Transcript_40040/m.116803 type:complete len:201 (-) Transcript_40040:164-766(-)